MLFLCLAILSSAAISLLMRFSDNKISARLSLLGVNYLICALLSAVYGRFDLLRPDIPGFSLTLVLGIVSGILFLGGFVLFQWNTSRNGVVLTSIFMKLGLLVPMFLSVLIFREIPTWSQITGFCIALGAIVLINLNSEQGAGRFRWQLLAMLLFCGGCDAMSKVFEALAPQSLSDQYLFYTFAVAFVLCAALVVCKKERPGLRELLFGTAIGIPNFFASKFLLLALKNLSAVVVFPCYSVATMLIVTLAGVLFYRERLRSHQWLALGAIIVALVLLNI